jgi:predicted O-linked N-acetylglucosamine transferase (SPINDLY family)
MHNKDQFELIAFSFGPEKLDKMRERLRSSFDQFLNVSNQSDQAVAQLSRDLEIDIAVDLGGFTSHGRTGIFAHRVAPIQISYLGYLGTMGAEYIDYLIADKVIIPPHLQANYSEQILYLPSYQVNDRKRMIPDTKFSRLELGLPENGFVFCSFNNNYKILPTIFSSWMRIIKAVEGSVLFLYVDNHFAEANLKKEAHARGVNPQRLIFGKRIPRDQYLNRYLSCDLFLDTFPYNAGATASDALWAGLPILTLKGKSFASRVAASLLSAIDLPELITDSHEKYEALAIDLATNPYKLAKIKKMLLETRMSTSLFNTPLFAQHLEVAYEQIMERYWANLSPAEIRVGDK